MTDSMVSSPAPSKQTVPPPAHRSREGDLWVESVPLTRIAVEQGTPCYVYSRATLHAAWQSYKKAMPSNGLICYAVKANSSLAILQLFHEWGAGFDIVSSGELQRVLAIDKNSQALAQKVIFSGVGKSHQDITFALQQGIKCFNVESISELYRIHEIAKKLGKIAPVSLRVNPDIDAKTHPYTSTGLKESKFGIPITQALSLYGEAVNMPHLQIMGVDCHIGSQLLDASPLLAALDRVLELVDALQEQGIKLEHLDMGGGLGIAYQQQEQAPNIADYIQALDQRIKPYGLNLLLEPGRSLVGNAGLLLTKVEYLKPGITSTIAKSNLDPLGTHKNFAIVDAAMNDLLRPALYQAWHNILSVSPNDEVPVEKWDIGGPVCESADFLGKGRELSLKEGDLLAIFSTGAYAMGMSSNYNSRPRAVEVLVDGENYQVIRTRESLTDLYAHEHLLPEKT